MMKSRYFTLICALLCINAGVLTAQNNHFDFTSKSGKTKIYYKVTDRVHNKAEVTYKNSEYGSYKGNVIIPDTVRFRGKTYNVTGIGDSAFFGCDNIDTVHLSQFVTYIGNGAFYLTNIKLIEFNENIESIGESAFANCNSIKDFTVNEKVKHIGKKAFFNSGLQNLTVNARSLDNSSSFNDISTLQHVTIGEEVTELAENIFAGCRNITDIDYNAIEFQGFSPISNIQSLQNVTIGDKVKVLPEEFIFNCKGVKQTEIPQSVETVYSFAFAQSGLETVVLPENLSQMGTSVFKDCKSLAYVELPDNLRVITENMFQGCDSLTEITIPANLTEIDSGAFMDCKSLVSYIFPDKMRVIGVNAFYGCDAMQTYICEAKTPPVLKGELYMPDENTQVEIDCSAILSYKNADYWNGYNYPCQMDNVMVQNSSQREVFDSKRNRTFTERIITTGDLSYVITNDRNKLVSVVASQTVYRDDITRQIEIPPQISDGQAVYTVTGIESLGVCRSVYIPPTVKHIDTMVFSGIDLEYIDVDADNSYFASSDGVLYTKDMRTLVAYPAGLQPEDTKDNIISLPQSVEHISYGAFLKHDKNILRIGKNVKTVGNAQEVNGFDVDADNPYIIRIGNIIISKDSSEVITAPCKMILVNNTLTLWPSVKKINDGVFAQVNVDTLVCQSATPPEIYEHTFDFNRNIVCIIPKGSLNVYKQNPLFKLMNLQEAKPAKATAKRRTAAKKR
ncbi:MAG: leucine-rich repeat domain-containing protein [Bacteroidales bacterium]|nr:leucine-rich repeat domain-containing protein [Bacteroidales bacterium]